MAYHSPLHILEALQLDPEKLDDEGITRLRKKILTEFQLTNDFTIKIAGSAYTKDAVLKSIDSLKELEGKEAHLFLFQNKDLLSFCENPEKAVNPYQKIKSLIEEHEDATLKGILIEAETAYFQFVLRNNHYKHALAFYQWFSTLPETYQFRMEETIVKHTQRIILRLETEDKSLMRTEHKNGQYLWISDGLWVEFYNALDQEYETMRNELALCMINFSVAFQGIHNKFLAKMSKQMVRLHCDNEYRILLRNNHRIYKENGKTSFGIEFRFIFAAIWIIVLILRCSKVFNTSSDYPSGSLRSIEYKIPKDLLKSEEYQRLIKFADSIKKAHGIPLQIDTIATKKLPSDTIKFK